MPTTLRTLAKSLHYSDRWKLFQVQAGLRTHKNSNWFQRNRQKWSSGRVWRHENVLSDSLLLCIANALFDDGQKKNKWNRHLYSMSQIKCLRMFCLFTQIYFVNILYALFAFFSFRCLCPMFLVSIPKQIEFIFSFFCHK